jgi:alginate O-acetyltransferase complex protein AlgI
LHGFFIVLERSFLDRILSRLPRALRHAYLLLVVVVGWVLFRAMDFEQAVTFYRHMFTWSWDQRGFYPLETFFTMELAFVTGVALVLCLPLRPWLGLRARLAILRAPQRLTKFILVKYGTVALGLALCAMALTAETHNPFLYFRF